MLIRPTDKELANFGKPDFALAQTKRQRDPVFGFEVVAECPGVPPQLLLPRETWRDPATYDAGAAKLATCSARISRHMKVARSSR